MRALRAHLVRASARKSHERLARGRKNREKNPRKSGMM
jgi:hypothetical protein